MSTSTMSTGSLQDLHLIHLRIASLRDQSERGPKQLEAKRKRLADKKTALEKAKADLKATKVHSHEKETDRKGFDNRNAQLQLQINTAKSNKEYTALVGEKEAAMKARGAVEDVLLELLMKEESQSKDIQTAEEEVRQLEKEFAEQEKVVAQQLEELKGKLGDAESRLAAAESTMPADMKDAYRRLLGRRGADSLAQVSGGNCMGCFTQVTPQMLNQLILHELVLCKSCGRILYLEETPRPAGE